jgi:zinc protease
MNFVMSARRSAVLLLSIALVGLCGSNPVAQAGATTAPAATAEPLPDAAVVLKKFRSAIGGEAAIRKHTTRTVTGHFELPAQGMKGELKIVAAAPDRMKLTITLPGMGNLERGYDGKIGYSLDPAVGPRILEGPELEELKYSADFYDDLRDPAKYASAVVVAQGPFEGEDCYEVKLVRSSGFTYHEFFSVKTGLLTGVKMNVTSQMGTVPVTTVHSEYKAFGGVMTPTVTRQKMMGLESITTIDSMTFDAVDEKAFALPDAIAALAAQAR